MALLAAAAVAAPAAVGAGSPGPREQALRDRDRALAAKSRAAVLDLYALETKLARAQSHLVTVEREAEALRRERRVVALELTVARRGVRITERRLARRIRALYEEGDVDPLAIVLGSDSLDAALSGIESLGQIANGDKRVLAAVQKARLGLTALQRRLAVRQRRLDGLVRDATATTHALASTRAARVAYVASLESRRRLTHAAIARLQDEARAAEQKTQALEAAPPAAPEAAAEDVASVTRETADPSSPDVEADEPAGDDQGGRTLTVVATGYALPGRTATGLPVGWGVVAVDPSVIPLGTKLWVPGYGEAVAADVGGAVRGATIDLWFPSLAQAHAWGRRTVTIRVR